MAISNYLADIWSVTDFSDPDLAGYAAEQMCADTRIGVQSMMVLALAMQLVITALAMFFDLDSLYIYMSLLIAALCLHVLISASFIKDIRTLHALGMTFLIAAALAITVLAHRSGSLSVGMMASVIMLLVAIPMIPWALRESTIVVGLIFALISLSLNSVPGRFDSGSLLVLQVLIVGTAVVVLVVTGKNTFIRKEDLKARYQLEQANVAMETLSMQDHLTGAWNRRFLDENFSAFADDCADKEQVLSIAVLDIDDFKGINDTFGHQVGDNILVRVAHTFNKLIDSDGHLIRLGGDEFLIAFRGEDVAPLIEAAILQLQTKTVMGQLTGHETITLSAGIAKSQPGEKADLNKLYRIADRALYTAKQERPGKRKRAPANSTMTGTWKL
ncbi:MAG: GGDEF domain-containing protein [Woeseiaceae bacterium]|nr:GGDEF domain-containing protein [Woeseiaceae bacterium]